MTVKVMQCPSCGHDLPPDAQQNQLVTCPACNATLYLSQWQIGQNDDAVVVATPTRVYTITDKLGADDLCESYRCAYALEGDQRQGIFRIARNPGDNDLVKTEAQMLFHLQNQPEYADYQPFLPIALESFIYQDATLKGARHVNLLGIHKAFNGPNELYTLEEIHQHYMSGIDTRDMAWMWRRLLFILGFVHQSGVVHGGVLPSHVMIEPKDHKLVLGGWGFSVRDPGQGNRMTAISISYEDWYPAEIKQKQPPTASVDLMMAARCMLYLVGADPLGDGKHHNVEPELTRYFAGIIRENPRQRPQDAWKLLGEFDRIIEKLWGPRKFRVFTMPYKV